MFKLRHISIQIKLMMLFGLLAAVLFVNVGFLFYESTSKEINNAKEAQLITLAQETANKIERFLFERYADIQVMAQSPLLRQPQLNKALKLDYLESVRNAYKTYDYLIYIDINKTIEFYTGDISNDNNYEKWIDKALNGEVVVSDFIYMEAVNEHKLYFLAPVKDENETIIGAVVERMSFDAIADIILSLKPAKSGYAYLLSNNGETIYHPEIKLNELKQLNNSTKGAVYSVLNENEYISAYYKINKYDSQITNWYVVIEEPTKEAFEVTERLMNYTILVIFISIIISFLLIILISHLITHPIKKLVKETKSIAEGDISQHIKIEGSDEIGSLANSFNTILNNLKSMMRQVLEVSGEAASMDEIKQYAEKVFDNIPSAAIIADSMGNITVFNNVASVITGIDTSSMLGVNINNCKYDSLNPLMEIMKLSLKNGDPNTKRVIQIENVNGKQIPVIANTSIRRDEKGKSIGVIALFRSVEEIKRIEESVVRTNSLRSLGELSAGMAHEIKNPLTSIKGYAQYIKSELGEGHELNSDISVILSEVERLNNIIDRFLTFARPQQPIYTMVNINDVIKRVVELLERDIITDSIKVNVNFESISTIQIDEEQICQVLMNIILNAVQAMPDGGVLRISTFTAKEHEEIGISIKDTGMGIEADYYDRIFEPFYTTKNKGTGLGLAISWRIIENHKGSIEVISSSDKGTEFIIILPIKQE